MRKRNCSCIRMRCWLAHRCRWWYGFYSHSLSLSVCYEPKIEFYGKFIKIRAVNRMQLETHSVLIFSVSFLFPFIWLFPYKISRSADMRRTTNIVRMPWWMCDVFIRRVHCACDTFVVVVVMNWARCAVCTICASSYLIHCAEKIDAALNEVAVSVSLYLSLVVPSINARLLIIILIFNGLKNLWSSFVSSKWQP